VLISSPGTNVLCMFVLILGVSYYRLSLEQFDLHLNNIKKTAETDSRTARSPRPARYQGVAQSPVSSLRPPGRPG